MRGLKARLDAGFREREGEHWYDLLFLHSELVSLLLVAEASGLSIMQVIFLLPF